MTGHSITEGFTKHLSSKWVVATFILLTIAMICLGWLRSDSAHFGSDFHMYFTSGQHFTTGELLYDNPHSGAPYVYPPFAAFLFQLLNLTNEGYAIGVIFVLNYLMTLINSLLIYAIARKLNWTEKQATIGIFFALAVSFSDVWNNINFSQINPFIFCLTLSGILAYVSERKSLAFTFWTIGAWVKVLPVIFIFWGLARKFNLRSLLTVGLTSLLCVGLPVVQRGFNLGLQDLTNYYHQFLFVNMNGVNIIWRNQSLSAALTRAFVPIDQLVFLDVDWAKNVVANSPIWIKICSLAVLISTLTLSWWCGRKKLEITVIEVALIFLATHLFSGVTWRGHLLTTMFIFLPLFRFYSTRRAISIIQVALILFIAITFLSPKGILGPLLFKQFHLWSFPTWCLLSLLVFYSIQLFQSNLTHLGNGLKK